MCNTRAIVTEERLRHKRDRLVVLPRDVAHNVFVVLHVVAHRLERREANIDFGLSGTRHLVMLALARDAGFSSSRHISLRMSCSVSAGATGNNPPSPGSCNRDWGTLRAGCSNVPRCCRPRVKRAVARETETNVVENEKLRFRPKNAVSAMPVLCRYASAFSATPRGSRLYGSRVIGSTIVQMRLRVGSALKISIQADAGSGMTSMSEALIAFHPRILEPSKPRGLR